MPLELNELLKKAKQKGISGDLNNPTKPWHQESVIINLTSKEKELEREYRKTEISSYGNQLEETPDKQGTNRGQIGDSIEDIRGQTGDKQGANRGQIGDSIEDIRGQTGDKQGANRGQIGDKQGTNRGQNRGQIRTLLTSTMSHAEILKLVNSLTGLQKKLFFHLIENCSLNGTLETSQLTSSELRLSLNFSVESLKTTVKRLIKKNLIKRKNGKTGRGGFIIFTLDEAVRKVGIEVYRKLPAIEQIGDNWGTKQGTHNDSSSSLNYNTTYYSKIEDKPQFLFDIESLLDIGLTQKHVNQLVKLENLTPEQIQECIDHFAFDLIHNDKAKTFKLSPLDVFMGTLRKGNYYNAPPNYESKKARNLRLSLEAKMRREQIQKELEEKLKEFEWKEWSEKLAEQELMQFYIEKTPIDPNTPEKVQKIIKRRNALTNAREYFEAEIWPKKREHLAIESPVDVVQ